MRSLLWLEEQVHKVPSGRATPGRPKLHGTPAGDGSPEPGGLEGQQSFGLPLAPNRQVVLFDPGTAAAARQAVALDTPRRLFGFG